MAEAKEHAPGNDGDAKSGEAKNNETKVKEAELQPNPSSPGNTGTTPGTNAPVG